MKMREEIIVACEGRRRCHDKARKRDHADKT